MRKIALISRLFLWLIAGVTLGLEAEMVLGHQTSPLAAFTLILWIGIAAIYQHLWLRQLVADEAKR